MLTLTRSAEFSNYLRSQRQVCASSALDDSALTSRPPSAGTSRHAFPFSVPVALWVVLGSTEPAWPGGTAGGSVQPGLQPGLRQRQRRERTAAEPDSSPRDTAQPPLPEPGTSGTATNPVPGPTEVRDEDYRYPAALRSRATGDLRDLRHSVTRSSPVPS